ncbi:MAG TPA: ABC transporter permease [Kofleriaceae bacterium]|nr:ABC transporter permease [Kofleriaceae bacterium]
MRALDRKLVRDLSRMRGQVITIALVLAAGVAATISLTGTYRALGEARDDYYARHGFPDLWVHLERAPDAVAARLAALPGIASVEPRLVEPLTVHVPGALRPASGRIQSIADADVASLRGLVLRRGRPPDPARSDEVALLASFADAHGLEPGDRLDTVFAGRRQALTIAAIVLSPEHVFPVSGGMINPRGVAVVWMPRANLAPRVDRVGAFDDATFTLVPGASELGAIDAIDRELVRWGGAGAYGRKLQPSHMVVSSEIEQLQMMATRIPVVFLLVAAFLLNIVLGRLVRLQREQLGILRALGYGRGALARHVAAFAAVIVVLGAVLGVAAGAWLGHGLTDLYQRFFHFPTLGFHVEPDLAAIAIAVCTAAAAGGALGAMRQAARLAPAEAMRPPAPSRYRRGVLSWLGLARVAGPMGRMVVRELERKPVSTAISVVGVAFAVGIIIIGRFQSDSLDAMIDDSLMGSMREDVAVSLARPVPRSELGWFAHAPGVIAAEPAYAVPVRIRGGAAHRDVVLTGLPADGRLRRILDGRGRPVALPADGLLLSELLARRLDVRVGDPVWLERRDGDHRLFTLPVAATVDDRVGLNAYLELDALGRALHEEPRLSMVLLQVDAGAQDALLRALTDVPTVVDVAETAVFRDAFLAQSGDSMMFMVLLCSTLGGVIAVGVVYNHGRVALSERERDLATLRVLGYRRSEVAVVLLGQLAVQVALAIPIGLLFGTLMTDAIMATADPEQYRFAVLIAPRTYGFAALVIAGATFATALVMRRRLDRIDLTGALKARD